MCFFLENNHGESIGRAVKFSWTSIGKVNIYGTEPTLEFATEGIYKIGLMTTSEFGVTAFVENKKCKHIKSSQLLNQVL
jgi:hypothetical protein